jgi:signal transduction histidine kinase/DNA-binding response OmpR family regulator
MDIVTLAIYNAWITVTLTIGFAAVSAARRGPAHVLWWTAGNAARAIASLVLAFNLATGDLPTTLAANGLLLVSSALYLTSFERLTGRRGLMPPAIAVIAVTMGLVLAFTIASPDLKARIVSYSTGSGLLLLMCAVVAIRNDIRGRARPSLHAAGIVFAIFGGVTLARGLATLAGPDMDSVLASTWVQSGFLALAGMFYVGSNFAMLWSMVVEDGERHAAELESAREAAERASFAKSRFLATMSHELRTPLNGVLGAAQLLLGDPGVGPGPRQRVQMIASAGRHLLGVINDVLDFSKIEAGKLELQPRDGVDLRGLLTVVSDVVAPQATAKGLVLITDAAADLPHAIRADAMRLQQVLLNLLSNAVKFTPHGRVILRARRGEEGWLRFEVQDDGPGIPPERRHLLFKDFSQLDETATAATGTGLGLAISARLAAAMGGRLELDDSVTRGALFRFEVALPETPLKTGRAATALDRPEAAPPPPPAAEGRGPRVLVADDVEMNREVLAAMLKRLGCIVEKAEDGAEAVAITARGGIDLVLMDMRMPVMNGLEAARAIRGLTDPTLAGVPIVALTANAFDSAMEQCRDAGMNDYMAKPVQLSELAEMLQRYTRIRRAPPPAPPQAAAPHPEAPVEAVGDEMAAIDRLQRQMGQDRVAQMLDGFMATATDRIRRMTHDADPVVLADDARTIAGQAALLGLDQLALIGRRLAIAVENDEAEHLCRGHLEAFTSRLRATLVELLLRRARLREYQPY